MMVSKLLRHTSIRFSWAVAHVRVEGNEVYDRAAKAGRSTAASSSATH